MMIEQLKIRNQKGIGLVVLLYLILPFVAVALACFFWLSRPSLSRVPKYRITDQFALGTSLFWGTLCLIFGCIMLMPFLFSDMLYDQKMVVVFCFYFLPLPFTGLFILLHRMKYQKYKLLIDSLLLALTETTSLVKSRFCFYYHDKQFGFDKIIPFMRDLQYCEILTFAENEITVNYRFLGTEEGKTIEYEEKVWVCHSCGAKNEQRVIAGNSVCCEYCNTPLI